MSVCLFPSDTLTLLHKIIENVDTNRLMPEFALTKNQILSIRIYGSNINLILAIPPILINTILGFNEVGTIYQEVGGALGMNERQLLWQVKVPLALPYLLNGIKLALIEIIASATLATYIGAGGLGTLIFTGLGLYDMADVIIGGASVAMLSLITMVGFDLLIRKVENHEPTRN